MKKTVSVIFSVVFVAVLCAVFVFTVANMDKNYSFFENRTLAEIPEANGEDVLDGSFFDAAERAFTDHAPLRDAALAADVRLKLDALRLPVINDVVVADGELLHFYPFGYFDGADVEGGIAQAADRAESESRAAGDSGARYIYVGLPSQLTYFSGSYPGYLEHGEGYTDKLYTDYFNALRDRGVDHVDMRRAFDREGADPGFYMQTDHHLSFDGAYLTYREIISRLNEKGMTVDAIRQVDDFEKVTLPNPFIGSRNRKLYGLYPNTDSVSRIEKKIATKLTVLSDGGVYDSLYDIPENESDPVTYDFYMGGDHAETIVTGGSSNGLKALVCGSSYTNAVEPFLAHSFSEMRSLDLRYYKEKTLEQYVADYRPDVVIMIFDDGEFLKRAYD